MSVACYSPTRWSTRVEKKKKFIECSAESATIAVQTDESTSILRQTLAESSQSMIIEWLNVLSSQTMVFQAALDATVILLGQTKSEIDSSTIKEIFLMIADQWEKSTKHHSNIYKRIMHPLYRKIVFLGEPAVPILLEQVKQGHLEFSFALTEITGFNPEEFLTDLTYEGIRQAWMDWATKNPV